MNTDPEYLEFLEFLAKPVENLPSAEIQLERREAERVGALKDSFIVTPLMDFVRRKRAAKVGSRKSLSNGRLSRRAGGQSGGIPSSASSKEVLKIGGYVLSDSLKNASGKDKSTYILVSRRDEHQLPNKPVILASSVGTEVSEEESGATRITDADKNKVLLLKGKGKGKGKEISHVAGSILHQQNFTSPIKTILRSTPTKLNSRRENRIIRGILLNKDSRQSQCPGFQSEQHIETSNLKKERRPPWHPQANLGLKDACNASDGNVAGNHLHGAKKLERRSRNKDRTDHGVWTLRHSDGSCASDESLPSSASQSAQILIDSSEGACGDTKVDFSSVGSCKGSSKHISRRVAVANGSSAVNDGKPGKRANVYGSHEVKQVWVQKSSSGS
ncbi:MAM domain-containing glycosylphosphatidylinositol anchor 1 [Gossypium arboreum]|uniref:MAM domain-containing glycosylphosphatidylinositol anchor 1 n=1 Tax=Gossypium arboreum TaxID=29729 RepID=A0A0B0PKE8_GOSAR|nr:MAM domain-containing glycosylphosphatidylinositol anchor 1 [Gossypium arboreum]